MSDPDPFKDPYTAAWLAEMWKAVPEVPRETREVQRQKDREKRRAIEAAAFSPQLSTECAEPDSLACWTPPEASPDHFSVTEQQRRQAS